MDTRIETLIKTIEEQAKRIYSYPEILVSADGSSAGILAAITALPEGRILLARNCRKAAFDAVSLNRRKVGYLYPEELFPQLCYAYALQYPHVPFRGTFRYEMTVSGAIQLIRMQYDGRFMHIQERSGIQPMDEEDWSRAPVWDCTVNLA